MGPLSAVTVVAVLALALAGCKRSGPSGACGAGETANADPPVCYRVPKGFTARGEPKKRAGWFSLAYGDDTSHVEFIVRDLDSFDSTWKALQNNPKGAKATDAKEEDVAGGKGKLLTYSTPEKDPKHVISVVLRGAKHSLECEAEYRTSTPKPELLDICKAIHEP